MKNKNREYRKKYGDIGVKIGMVCFLSCIIAAILLYPEGITSKLGAIVALIFSGAMILLMIVDLIIVKYTEQGMSLSMCKKTSHGMYQCIFFDPVSNKSITFLMQKPITFDLVENQIYKVVVARGGVRPMIMDVLGVENDANVINELKTQTIDQQLSLMEYNEQVFKQQEAVNDVTTTANQIKSVANKIKAIIGLLIGGFFIYGGFHSVDTSSMVLSFGFGGLIILLMLSNLLSQK